MSIYYLNQRFILKKKVVEPLFGKVSKKCGSKEFLIMRESHVKCRITGGWGTTPPSPLGHAAQEEETTASYIVPTLSHYLKTTK